MIVYFEVFWLPDADAYAKRAMNLDEEAQFDEACDRICNYLESNHGLKEPEFSLEVDEFKKSMSRPPSFKLHLEMNDSPRTRTLVTEAIRSVLPSLSPFVSPLFENLLAKIQAV